ncbi:fatty acid desaturase [Noviherbaspirillum galbum]|uniref:Beta-carotene ketolase n=1 Tax=Noviherbaspirillum galbum TaxID=2709383 RepID=A0A6B3SPE8_9BURK|nr:fatty acid desaturase [Noviherbaspirillum galbum]NEX59599.1 beta-carotene ketolase [Noviherbaspirillum galbum]
MTQTMSPARQSRIGVGLALLVMAAWLAFHLGGIFLFDITFAWPAPLEAAALVVLQTWLSVGLYIVAHDAMHGSLWPTSRAAGDRLGQAAVWLYAGFSYRDLIRMHHAHHRLPGSAEDPDFSPEMPHRLLPWYARFMRTYLTTRQAVTMLLRVTLYLLLGARLENIVLFFAVPGLLSSLQLFYFGTYLPHRHKEGEAGGFADHHRARSNAYGYLGSLLSCFHFGYHHEHHLHPGVPWWRLPALRRA